MTVAWPPRRPSTDAPRPLRASPDAVSFLTVFVVLVFAVPSHLTVTALGSLGRLSVLWGLMGLAWWAYVRLQQSSRLLSGSLPVRYAVQSFFGVIMLSYGLAHLAGMPSEDSTWSDASLLRALSWAGVVLVALDGIHDRERLMVLVRRLVWAGALVACLGLAQFATGQALVDSLTLPGFNAAPEYATVFDRDGYTRSAGTASHPLAYGSMLVMLMPVAFALAVNDVRRPVPVRWAPPAVIAVAAVLSMSRSVLISTVVGLVLVAPAVPRRHRLRAVAAGIVLLVAISFLAPGMLRKLREMVEGIGNDASSLSRTDSAGPALEIALRNPLWGRGFGTFMPTELILDNQVILLLVEVGILGLAAFVLVVGSCLSSGWWMHRHAADPRDRALGPAFAAGLAAGFTTMCFYDALAFPLAAELLFLMVGITGAAVGIARDRPRLFTAPQLS